jgi:putative DNA primase/helicase
MRSDDKRQSKLEAALGYAKEGWPVLPLHSTIGDRCTCRNQSCGSKGKHPRTEHGIKDASRKAAQVRAWWTKWPDANIGLVTGQASGRIVLDIDVKKGKKGLESLAALIEEHGALPETLTARTPSGGWHYVFRIPDRAIKSHKGVRDGVDLLADGSYFVASPSVIQ